MADKIYSIEANFHLGNLINDWVVFYLDNHKDLCNRRNRPLDYYEEACESFQHFLRYFGEIFQLEKSTKEGRLVDDVILNVKLKAGINNLIKDQHHHILETTMDEIREHLRDYGDIIIVRAMVFDDEEGDEECTHSIEDILEYWEYYENPLRYIEFVKVEKIS